MSGIREKDGKSVTMVMKYDARREMMRCQSFCLHIGLPVCMCQCVRVSVCRLTCSVFLQEAALHVLYEQQELGICLARTGRAPPCTQHW
jgi:hypothetical protein